MFVFVLVVALFTGLIFGIAPALRSSRTPIVEALKEETRTAGRSAHRITLANTLLVGQVAVSLVLLVTAALFLRSVQREYTFDPGFETKNLAMFMLYPGQQGYDRTKTEQSYKDVRDRLATVPGVASMSWATNLPLWRRAETGIMVEGHEQRKKSEAISSVINTIDLEYFSTMGIPLLAGATSPQTTAKAHPRSQSSTTPWPADTGPTRIPSASVSSCLGKRGSVKSSASSKLRTTKP